MKILAVSDEECPALWDHYVPGRLDGYDLIISCGDLKADYLSFLVTMGRVPLLYVHGNHDEGYDRHHPGNYQITEAAMRRRIARLRWALWCLGGVDLVVTHAPPRHCGDRDDPAHMGFEALVPLLERWRPAWLIHGHVHLRYDHNAAREHRCGDTRVLNVCERYTLELPDRPFDPADRGRILWKNRCRKTDD